MILLLSTLQLRLRHGTVEADPPAREFRVTGVARWEHVRHHLGAPVHALVIHVVVILVLLPLPAVVAIAAVPRWRDRFGVLVLALATVGFSALPVATRSGGKLEDRLGASGVVARQINHHQEWGQRVIWATLAMWLLAVVLMLMDRQRREALRQGGRRLSPAGRVAAATR